MRLSLAVATAFLATLGATEANAQKAPLARAIEEHLRNPQTDQLAVRDPRRTTKAPSRRQEIINQHVKARQQSVEVGGHSRLLWSTVYKHRRLRRLARGPYFGINRLASIRLSGYAMRRAPGR